MPASFNAGRGTIEPRTCVCRMDCLGSNGSVFPTSAQAYGVLPINDRWDMASTLCTWGVKSDCARFSYLSQLRLPCQHLNERLSHHRQLHIEREFYAHSAAFRITDD